MATSAPAHIAMHGPGGSGGPTPLNYNPRSPCVLGIEWFPASDQFAYLDSDRAAIACALVADTADTIQNVWAMMGAWYGKQTVSLEIYDITAGPPPLDAVSWSTFYPGCDRYNAPAPWRAGSWGPVNAWNPAAGTGSAVWTSIDSASLTPYTWPLSGQPVANNEFAFSFFGLGFDFAVGFAGTSGAMAGTWITRLRSHAKVAQYYAFDRPSAVTIIPYVWLDGDRFLGTPFSVVAEQGAVDINYDWPVNPKSGLPWTPGDVDGFDCALLGANNGMGFIAQPTGSANNMATVLQADLQVESAASDPRLAMASQVNQPVAVDGTGQGWTVFEVRDTQTGILGTITLTKGNKYLFVWRVNPLDVTTVTAIACIAESPVRSDPRNVSGVVGPAPLETSLAVYGPPYWTQYTGPLGFGQMNRAGVTGRGVLLDPASRRIVDLGIESGITAGIMLQEPAFGVSKDSQPYATISPTGARTDEWPALNEWFNNSPINVGRYMEQEITAIASDTYGWVWVMCSMIAGVTDADLLIKVKRRSDNVQFGGTVTITSTTLVPPVDRWQKVGVRLPADATLVAGTQYYLEITSAASANQGWAVQCVNSGYEPNPTGPPAGTNAVAGSGGAVDKLTFGDPMMERFGFTPPDDPGSVVAEVNLSTIPETPAGFVAAASGQTCCIDFIQLSWTPIVTISCGTFLAYEIERDDGDGVWRRIALITDQAVSGFDDYESMANTPANYRMRMLRDDAVPSDWSATETATAAMVGCVGLMFTSNESPDLTVFYQDTVDARVFNFPSFENTFAPYARDYQVVFREIEDRGTTFQSTLRVRSGAMPCGPGCDDDAGFGPDVFTPLKTIARAGLSYVCVKNEAGNRWFAYIKTPAGKWEQHGIEKFGGWAAYTMSIESTEVTDVPSAPNSGVIGS